MQIDQPWRLSFSEKNFGGFKELTKAVSASIKHAKIKTQLRKVPGPVSLKSILTQKSGSLLLLYDNHCIAIDCSDGVLLDCAAHATIPATAENVAKHLLHQSRLSRSSLKELVYVREVHLHAKKKRKRNSKQRCYCSKKLKKALC